MLLEKVIAAGPDQQRCGLLAQLVPLAVRRVGVRDGAPDGIHQVRLTADAVRPSWRIRILEIGHEHLRARVERVDDHLSIDRAGDLDPAVQQIRRWRSHVPVAFADSARFGQEGGLATGVERGLRFLSARQQFLDARPKSPSEIFDEGHGACREDPVRTLDLWNGHNVPLSSTEAAHEPRTWLAWKRRG